jgi:hypothetical protein
VFDIVVFTRLECVRSIYHDMLYEWRIFHPMSDPNKIHILIFVFQQQLKKCCIELNWPILIFLKVMCTWFLSIRYKIILFIHIKSTTQFSNINIWIRFSNQIYKFITHKHKRKNKTEKVLWFIWGDTKFCSNENILRSIVGNILALISGKLFNSGIWEVTKSS